MSLEIKKEKTKNNWLFLMMNCRTECPCILFRRWNALSKVRLVDLEALTPQ